MPARLSTRRRAHPGTGGRPAKRGGRAATVAPDQDGRERILQVAIRAFSELGYEGATTAGIARDAGVTQPLVHHHFGSKEGLWRAAMDLLFGNVPRFVATDGGVAEGLLGGIEPFVRFVAAHPEATRVIAREGATPSARLDYLVDRHLREPFREVVDLLRAARRGGLLAADLRPELVLFFLLGAGSHLFDVKAFAARSVGIDASSEKTIEEFVRLVRDVLAHGLFGRAGTRGRR